MIKARDAMTNVIDRRTLAGMRDLVADNMESLLLHSRSTSGAHHDLQQQSVHSSHSRQRSRATTTRNIETSRHRPRPCKCDVRASDRDLLGAGCRVALEYPFDGSRPSRAAPRGLAGSRTRGWAGGKLGATRKKHLGPLDIIFKIYHIYRVMLFRSVPLKGQSFPALECELDVC